MTQAPKFSIRDNPDGSWDVVDAQSVSRWSAWGQGLRNFRAMTQTKGSKGFHFPEPIVGVTRVLTFASVAFSLDVWL
jgi:hypothetical protein